MSSTGIASLAKVLASSVETSAAVLTVLASVVRFLGEQERALVDLQTNLDELRLEKWRAGQRLLEDAQDLNGEARTNRIDSAIVMLSEVASAKLPRSPEVPIQANMAIAACYHALGQPANVRRATRLAFEQVALLSIPGTTAADFAEAIQAHAQRVMALEQERAEHAEKATAHERLVSNLQSLEPKKLRDRIEVWLKTSKPTVERLASLAPVEPVEPLSDLDVDRPSGTTDIALGWMLESMVARLGPSRKPRGVPRKHLFPFTDPNQALAESVMRVVASLQPTEPILFVDPSNLLGSSVCFLARNRAGRPTESIRLVDASTPHEPKPARLPAIDQEALRRPGKRNVAGRLERMIRKKEDSEKLRARAELLEELRDELVRMAAVQDPKGLQEP